MAKFGDLLDDKKPILLAFYSQQEPFAEIHLILKDISAAIGDKGKVIKIDVKKNEKLSEALRVKVLPTFMIYKFSTMIWRQSGSQDANTLIGLLQEHTV